MFKKKNYKKIIFTSLSLLLVAGTVGLAANNVVNKKIPATYGVVKLENNGKDITNLVNSKYGKPAFISEDSTYVPARAIAEVLGVEVKWNQATKTANFVDKKSSLEVQLTNKEKKLKDSENKLKEAEKEVKKLKEENEKLKKENEELKKNKSTNIGELEKELEKRYADRENVYFDIILKGNEKRLDVTLEANLRDHRQEKEWESMSYSDREIFVEDIVYDIEKNLPKADIKGEIRDRYHEKSLMTFDQRSGGKLYFNHKNLNTDYREIEEKAMEEIRLSLEYIKGVNKNDFKVDARLDRNGKDIQADVKFLENFYITDNEFKEALYEAESYIQRKYSDSYLTVDVYDKNNKIIGRYANNSFR